MIFHGRWVPAEVMDTIMLLWLLAAAIMVCVLLRVGWRRRPLNTREQGKPPVQGRKRRVRRRK
ncbi:MAG TPA: hypothetical protein DHV59_18160 [Oxalobacteraceae bacterium]|nr:hypothetical protein [Oxalobacteraceae bacterium]